MSVRPKLQFLVGTTESNETVYGDFRRTGGFISTGHVGSGHASYDEAAFVADEEVMKIVVNLTKANR